MKPRTIAKKTIATLSRFVSATRIASSRELRDFFYVPTDEPIGAYISFEDHYFVVGNEACRHVAVPIDGIFRYAAITDASVVEKAGATYVKINLTTGSIHIMLDPEHLSDGPVICDYFNTVSRGPSA